MRVAFGTDDTTPLSEALKSLVGAGGHDLMVLCDPASWPEVGATVGHAVADGAAEVGVVCCWTGTGVSIAANKVRGVRAALCVDAETARGARRYNDANVLAISLRSTSEGVAAELLDAFFTTDADPGEATTIAAVE